MSGSDRIHDREPMVAPSRGAGDRRRLRHRVARRERRRRPGTVRVHGHRRRPFEPHLSRHRRRRDALRPPPAAARPRAGERPRHGSRAPDPGGPATVRRAGAAGRGVLRRPGGQRRAVLRHALRRRARRCATGRRRSRSSTRRHASNVSRSLVDTMAAIHAVDLVDAGLDDLGRHDGIHRAPAQAVVRPVEPAQDPRTRHRRSRSTMPSLDRIPEQGAATIVHGDYRLDNCMVDDDGDVVAVLDWEICTLGDPLADIGLLQVYWTGPGDAESAWTGNATTAAGFSGSSPTRRPVRRGVGTEHRASRLLRRVRLLEARLHPRRRVLPLPRRRTRRAQRRRARAVQAAGRSGGERRPNSTSRRCDDRSARVRTSG